MHDDIVSKNDIICSERLWIFTFPGMPKDIFAQVKGITASGFRDFPPLGQFRNDFLFRVDTDQTVKQQLANPHRYHVVAGYRIQSGRTAVFAVIERTAIGKSVIPARCRRVWQYQAEHHH